MKTKNSKKEELIKQRLLQLRRERQSACLNAEDMYWSPQEKERHIKLLDREIELTEEFLDEVRQE